MYMLRALRTSENQVQKGAGFFRPMVRKFCEEARNAVDKEIYRTSKVESVPVARTYAT
jgi:hypothetical protein